MTVHVPASLERVGTSGAELLRTHPSWTSYWRAWLAAAGVLLLWSTQQWIFDRILELLGAPYEISWLGLAIGLVPLVGGVLFHRYTHVFEIDGRQRVRSRVGFVSRRIDEFSISPRIQIRIDQSVAGRLLNFGTVRFWTGDDRSELEWTRVAHPTQVAAFFNALKAGSTHVPPDAVQSGATTGDRATGAKSAASRDRPQGVLPPGARLGDRVAVVPGLSGAFGHSGSVSGLFEHKPYTWIERGTPIGHYALRAPRFDVSVIDFLADFFAGPNVRTALVRSPVTGLVLHSSYNYSSDVSAFTGAPAPDWQPPTAALAILLAQDDAAPEDGTYLFSDVCRLARDESRSFHRTSRYRSTGPIAPEDLAAILRRQESTSCRLVAALPTYREYIEEALTKFPSLGPHLGHLR